MPSALQQLVQFEKTPEDPQWRETLRVWNMRSPVYAVVRPDETQEQPQWRETVQV